MKRTRNNWIALAIVGSLLTMGVGLSVAVANAASSEAASSAQADEARAAPTSEPTSEKKALDGAKVYAWNCGSCHSERWPKERSDNEWDVIATHMRVRANMTAEQTEAVLHYLKENN